jgi:dUTP pyrophosphatase
MLSFLSRKRQQSEHSSENLENQLSFSVLSSSAVLPTKQHSTDAGYDLYSANDSIVEKGQSKLINTNIAVKLPLNHCGLIAGRSGLALHHSILVHSGVIDRGFCGGIGVILFNLGSENYSIKRGDRIAQLVVAKLFDSEDQPATPSKRGNRGFGSSGI